MSSYLKLKHFLLVYNFSLKRYDTYEEFGLSALNYSGALDTLCANSHYLLLYCLNCLQGVWAG